MKLKHLLATLALEAIREPEQATWAPIPEAYAAIAGPGRYAVSPSELERRIDAQGAGSVSRRDLSALIARGLFEESSNDLIGLPPAFTPHLAYLQRQAPRLIKALDTLRRTGTPQGVAPSLVQGVVLLNAGLFFECHELLEGVWKATAGPAKDFFHGIVQVAAAFYHYEKGNLHGARTLLSKGRRRLEPYPPTYGEIRLQPFRAALRDWAAHFEHPDQQDRPTAYPVIEFEKHGSAITQ